MRAGLRRNLAVPIAVERTRPDVGILRKKELHHLAAIFRRSGGPHQRRLVVKRFPRVDIRAGLDQHLDHGQRPRFNCQHQCGLAVLIGRIRMRASIQQRSHHASVAQLGGFGQRRGSELIRNLDLRFFRDKRVEEFIIHFVNRPMYGACTVGLSRVDIRSGANLSERRFVVSLLNEIGEGNLRGLRPKGHGSGEESDRENVKMRWLTRAAR